MKLSLKHQSFDKKSNEACTITEYPLDDKSINVAVAKITGRYPTTGNALNRICKEVAYVHEGSGKVFIKDTDHYLETGDVVLIEPGEKFHWEGNMTVFISCTPAWTKEQSIPVD